MDKTLYISIGPIIASLLLILIREMRIEASNLNIQRLINHIILDLPLIGVLLLCGMIPIIFNEPAAIYIVHAISSGLIIINTCSFFSQYLFGRELSFNIIERYTVEAFLLKIYATPRRILFVIGILSLSWLVIPIPSYHMLIMLTIGALCITVGLAFQVYAFSKKIYSLSFSYSLFRAILDQLPYVESVTKSYSLSIPRIPSTFSTNMTGIVIILVESLSTVDSKLLGGIYNRLPHFDSLLEKGTFFKNCLAHGNETFCAISTIATGWPQPVRFYSIGSADKSVIDNGILKSLCNAGWHTEYLTTSPLKFNNKDSCLPKLGFRSINGRDEIPAFHDKCGGIFTSASDGVLYSEAKDRIASLGKSGNPFVLIVKTMSSHAPWVDENNQLSDESSVWKYVDKELSDFYNTLPAWLLRGGAVAIVGDHRKFGPVSADEQNHFGDTTPFRVPLFISGMKFNKGEINHALTCHSSILPKILGIKSAINVPDVACCFKHGYSRIEKIRNRSIIFVRHTDGLIHGHCGTIQSNTLHQFTQPTNKKEAASSQSLRTRICVFISRCAKRLPYPFRQILNACILGIMDHSTLQVMSEIHYTPSNARFLVSYGAGKEELICMPHIAHFERKTLLNLLCGEGREANFFCSKGFTVTGVDSLPHIIERAREFASQNNLNAKFIVSHAESFLFAELYSVIYLSPAMYGYIGDSRIRTRLLERCAKSLELDGIIIISCRLRSRASVYRHLMYYFVGNFFGFLSANPSPVEMGDHFSYDLFMHSFTEDELHMEAKTASLKAEKIGYLPERKLHIYKLSRSKESFTGRQET